MSYPASHKTVFVLDQSAHFLQTSCDQHFEFDVVNKMRQPTGIIPLTPITKSLWTCSVEAIAEYCRIVWDVFPDGDKLIRFISSDYDSAHHINSWDENQQNLSVTMESFAKSSILANIKLSSNINYKNNEKSPIIKGLNKAIEALSQPTKIQSEKRFSVDSKSSLINRGRIICISSFRNDSHIRSIEEIFIKSLYENNNLISSNNSTKNIIINFCELVFMNTFPMNDQSLTSKIIEIPCHEICPLLSSEVHSVKSGSILAAKLGYLVLKHYDLASTTVTGIPMKEEQNAASSANYDVEIVHPALAHADLYKSGAFNVEGVCARTMKENFPYDTVTLRWCTPRTNAVELHYCTSAYRITSIDVNSRPSSCLTNFLLSGRSVMLEIPRMKGAKTMSHMLSSHNGELYIHTLGAGRSILEDPPSISEGSGGRVTDYRINDFGELMKKNRLIQCRVIQTSNKEITYPIEKAKQFLIRQTLYWPLVIGHTILFNMQAHLQQFLNLIIKDSLTTDDVLECKKAIYVLLGLENKGTTLPIPTIGTRGKGPKREELYRMMWNEFEHFLREYCSSPEHTAVLNCLLECRSKPDEKGQSPYKSTSATSATTTTTTTTTTAEEDKKPINNSTVIVKTEPEWAWKEWTNNDLNDNKYVNDAPPPKKIKLSSPSPSSKPSCSSGSQSLFNLWVNKISDENSKKRTEFAGRSNGKIAKLYTHLNEKVE